MIEKFRKPPVERIAKEAWKIISDALLARLGEAKRTQNTKEAILLVKFAGSKVVGPEDTLEWKGGEEK